jgi:hypothetical protein
MWMVLINLLVIAGSLSFSKLAICAHMIGCALLTIFSVTITYNLIWEHGAVLDPSDFKFYFHVLWGALCLGAILYQSTLGIMTRMSNILGSKSINILGLKKLHMVSGLIIVILAKIQVYQFI